MDRKLKLDDEKNPVSAKDLRKLAVQLGIDGIPANAPRERLLAMIGTVSDKTEFTLVDDSEDKQPEGTPPSKGKPYARAQQPELSPGRGKIPSRGKVLVMIHEQEGKAGKEMVPLSLNGSVLPVPRNKDVYIPYEFFVVLENSKQQIYEMDEKGERMGDAREVPLYNWSQKGPLPEDVILERKARAAQEAADKRALIESQLEDQEAA